MRLRKKNTYKKPVVTNILLDKDQAVLQVCRLGGAYFGWVVPANTECVGVGTAGSGIGQHCITAVKGQSHASNLAAPSSHSSQPS